MRKIISNVEQTVILVDGNSEVLGEILTNHSISVDDACKMLDVEWEEDLKLFFTWSKKIPEDFLIQENVFIDANGDEWKRFYKDGAEFGIGNNS